MMPLSTNRSLLDKMHNLENYGVLKNLLFLR